MSLMGLSLPGSVLLHSCRTTALRQSARSLLQSAWQRAAAQLQERLFCWKPATEIWLPTGWLVSARGTHSAGVVTVAAGVCCLCPLPANRSGWSRMHDHNPTRLQSGTAQLQWADVLPGLRSAVVLAVC